MTSFRNHSPWRWSTILLVAISIVVTSRVQAQRETFEASVVREAADIQSEYSQKGRKAGSTILKGVDAAGQAMSLAATDIAVTFPNVHFKLNSTELSGAESERQVAEIALALQSPALTSMSFLIEGHTCDVGGDVHNALLSVRRAEAVKKLLVSRGVAPERLAVLGLGKREPVQALTSADSQAAAELKRAANRRVVLRILSTGQK